MEVRSVSPQQVVELRQQAAPLDILDVRTPAEYAAVHVEGSRSVPLDRLYPPAEAAARNGTADAPIYLLCRSGGRAARAWSQFHGAGFENVFTIDGGIDAWQKAGLPVVRGPKQVMSLERQVRVAAGSLVLLGVVLGWSIHPALYGLSAFIGAGLIFAGVTDWCGMGIALSKMPWNRPASDREA